MLEIDFVETSFYVCGYKGNEVSVGLGVFPPSEVGLHGV